MNDQLVVYLDILGVGARLRAADTAPALLDVHQVICAVQRELDLPARAGDPAKAATANREVGKRIIALSDGIVMAVDPVSRASADHDPHDVVCMELGNLIYAQGVLAERGIFLRGGIAHGRFFFEDDVLVSPALAEAHHLESQVAKQPRIVIHQKTVDWLFALAGGSAYNGEEPTRTSLRPAGDLPPGHHMLDYLPVLANARDTDWVDKADLRLFRRTRNPRIKQAVLNRQVRKAARLTFRRHREAVRRALTRIKEPRVLAKYVWLMDYHNEVVHGFLRQFHDCKFTPRELAMLRRRLRA